MSGECREGERASQPDPRPLPRSRAGWRLHSRPTTPTRSSLNTPLPSITTFNTNSLCMHAQDTPGRRRRARKLNYTNKLLRTDILCLQETQLGQKDTSGLDIYFPQHKIHYNNLRLGRAGTATLISRRFAKKWLISPVDIGDAAVGWVQVLHFTPQGAGAGSRKDFHLVNCYLPAGGEAKKRLKLVDKVREIGRSGLMFMVGDMNMIDCEEDASAGSSSSILLKGAHRRFWDRFLADTRLKEVHQPAHTHFFLPEDPSLSRSSRIDRIYINIPDGILLFANPVAHTPFAGPSPLTMGEPGGDAGHFSRLHVSDHVPVSLFPGLPSRCLPRRVPE